MLCVVSVFFFQAEDGIRDLVRSRGLGDVYKRQKQNLYGSISVGKYADILILEKNPLDNIDNLQSVDLVMINGQQIILKNDNE